MHMAVAFGNFFGPSLISLLGPFGCDIFMYEFSGGQKFLWSNRIGESFLADRYASLVSTTVTKADAWLY